MGLFLKLIGSLLFVAIIFFGSFLAYIAFNPAEAVFFTNTFNIDPNDVQRILKNLVNGSFGFIMIIVSIAWIISLFRAFWVPKELKRKRLLSWLYAGVIGLILFMILAFWGYIFRIV
jgi:cellobiose-specific phosphotransferase system component IIC